MKKVLFLTSLLLILLTTGVCAANVGDKISEALYTDIYAYVNNYPISCYVVDGYAVIVAEDLRDYCCDVTFDETTRSLNITKSQGNTFNAPRVYYENKEVGEFYTDVLYTDIKTYVNGTLVKSFNVNGKTMITIDEFGKAMDGYEWDAKDRLAMAWLVDKPKTELEMLDLRMECLFSSYGSQNANKCGEYFDIDLDGVDEYIEVVNEFVDGESILRIIVDGKEEYVGPGTDVADEYELDQVIACDMNTADGKLDLVIVDGEKYGEYNIKIFRCNGDGTWTQYKWNLSPDLSELDAPYTDENAGIEFTGKATFALESTQKSKSGKMTSVTIIRNFMCTDDCVIEEIIPPYYELAKYRTYKMYYGSEWSHIDYSDNGFEIKRYDSVVIRYWNGDDYYYVEKVIDGTGGWMYLTDEIVKRITPNWSMGI